MSENYNEVRRPRETAAISGGAVLRGAAGVLGLLIIIVGLVLAVRTFGEIHDTVREPVNFQEQFKKWVEVLGAEETIKVKDQPVPLAQALGIVTVGGAYFLMCWLSIGVMVAGARIISWTTGDREAVRKIIRETLGPTRRPRE